MRFPTELATKLLEALGLQDQLVRKLDLHFEAEHIPWAEVEFEVWDAGADQFVQELRRYDLVARP